MSAHRPFALPGDRPLERPDLPWDLSHLLLQVRLDLDAGSVEGTATWTCAPRSPEPGPLQLDAFAFQKGGEQPHRYGRRVHQCAIGIDEKDFKFTHWNSYNLPNSDLNHILFMK